MKTKKFFLMAAMLLTSMCAFAQSENNEPLKGDVNGDGKVDVADLTAIVKIIMENSGGTVEENKYYWYVGQEKPTLDNYTSLATQVNTYTSPYEYTNTSGSRGYTYILIHNSKSITSIIGKTTGGNIPIHIDNTINIDNYTVYKTVGATTTNATIIITIS